METTTGIDARAIANYFLSKAEVDQINLDPLQLMKLVYISHGWNLGLTWKPLISQRVFAWPHGPVIPDVYHAFKSYKYSPIRTRAQYYDYESGSSQEYTAPISGDLKDRIDRVWDTYKCYSGDQLSVMTHQPGTPWDIVTKGKSESQIRDIPIPNSVIRDHYRMLALKNQQKQNLDSNGK